MYCANGSHIFASVVLFVYYRKLDFFSSLSDWKLQLLGNLFRYVTVQQNDVVFSEGDLGRQLYIISQGSVKVTAKRKRKTTSVIAFATFTWNTFWFDSLFHVCFYV